MKADKNRIKTDRNSQKWSKTFFLYNFVNITIFTIFTFHSMFSMFWSNSNKLIFSVLKVLRLGFVIETCSKTSELFLICPFLRENLSTSSCTLFLFTETWFLGDLRLGIALNLSEKLQIVQKSIPSLFNLDITDIPSSIWTNERS